MILHSAYLNPFKPFTERKPDERVDEYCPDASENNLSRAVFSALGNAEIPTAASQVNKPALSLLAPFRIKDFTECGDDASSLQSLLKASVEGSLLSGTVDPVQIRDEL